MCIADIILLMIALIIFIIGCKKGLLKRISSFLAWIGTFIITSVLHEPVLKMLLDPNSSLSLNNIFDNMNVKIAEWVISKSEIFSQPLNEQSGEILTNALSLLGVPSFLHSYFLEGLSESINSGAGYTLGSYCANVIGTFIFSTIVYLVIFLLIFLIFKIIVHYIEKLKEVFAISLIDSVLGGIFSVLKYVVVLSIVFVVLSLIIGGSPETSKIYLLLAPYCGFENEFSICKYLYYENPLLKLISLISLDEIINLILN